MLPGIYSGSVISPAKDISQFYTDVFGKFSIEVQKSEGVQA